MDDLEKKEIIDLLEKNNAIISKMSTKITELKVYQEACDTKELYSFSEACKLLNYRIDKKKVLGRNDCLELFRQKKILQYNPKNMPYQNHIDSGNYNFKITKKANGMAVVTPFITSKGLKHFKKIINETYGEYNEQ